MVSRAPRQKLEGWDRRHGTLARPGYVLVALASISLGCTNRRAVFAMRRLFDRMASWRLASMSE